MILHLSMGKLKHKNCENNFHRGQPILAWLTRSKLKVYVICGQALMPEMLYSTIYNLGTARVLSRIS